MVLKIFTVKHIRLYVEEREEENRKEGEEKEGKEEGENKTALPTFSFTRHGNYFDYIREKASILY